MTAGSRDSLCPANGGHDLGEPRARGRLLSWAPFSAPAALLCSEGDPAHLRGKHEPQARIMRESEMVGQRRELERRLALPSPAFLSSSRSGDRGVEVTGVTDRSTSVGLKPMGTRGHSGSDESSRLCRCAVLVPSPSEAMNLSWRPRVLACGDMWGHVRAESQAQMPGEKPLVRPP